MRFFYLNIWSEKSHKYQELFFLRSSITVDCWQLSWHNLAMYPLDAIIRLVETSQVVTTNKAKKTEICK